MAYDTMYERIKRGEFQNKVPYPDKPNPDARREWREGEGAANQSFEEALAEEFGVTNHPKRSKLYNLAWSHGHSAGYEEVLSYYSEFVELIN